MKVVKDNLKLLQSNVKRIIGIIIELLKDQINVDMHQVDSTASVAIMLEHMKLGSQ